MRNMKSSDRNVCSVHTSERFCEKKMQKIRVLVNNLFEAVHLDSDVVLSR